MNKCLVLILLWLANIGSVGSIESTESTVGAQRIIRVSRPMPPPGWALAERALLAANSESAQAFADKYLDDRGYLRCVERWGGNDGADDAMENFSNWTLAYALGSPEALLSLFSKAWEGHLRQYTAAKAPSVEMARDGMYYKEFITSFDWEHNGEALAAFYSYGLCRPTDPEYIARVGRFAGFYMNRDPEAPNYDVEHNIIRSLHNGSRGPKLTPATEIDWGGEPVPGKPDRLARYRTAANIRGDHPLNLCAATLPMTAYLLTAGSEYREWLLEYVGAWKERTLVNGGNIPTNIGLDGSIGGEWDGKWYGGVFGWNFWPETSGRNYYKRGPRIAFGEAFLLTGDPVYLEPLRRQMRNLYAAKKVRDGKILLPNKYGDDGWYGYIRNQHFDIQRDIYLWSMERADLEWISEDPWIRFLEGGNPDYPMAALQEEFEQMRAKLKGLRKDPTTPDTRASDYSQRFSPVRTSALVNLTLGANDPGGAGNILHARVRYFDPVRQRSGLSRDVAALVKKLHSDRVVITLVNTNPVQKRSVVIQMGAYAEHHARSVAYSGKSVSIDGRHFQIDLDPGSGDTLTIQMERYRHQPTLAFPWERTD